MTTAILLASDSRRMRASTARSRKPEANKGQRGQQRTWNFFAGLEEHRSPTGNRSSCIHKIYPDLLATSDLTHLGLIADAEFGWPIAISRENVKHLGGLSSLGINCASCHVTQIARNLYATSFGLQPSRDIPNTHDMITKNIGMLLLAIYLIAVGILTLTGLGIGLIAGVLALLAGIFILIGR